MECLIYNQVKNKILSDKKIVEIVFFIFKVKKINKEVSVNLIGDKKMRELNKKYRHKDKTTDVLSFPSVEFTGVEKQDLGDIFISIPQIKRQAKNFGIQEKEEFIRMLVHSILHLLGYDHYKKNEALLMYNEQEKIVLKIKKICLV